MNDKQWHLWRCGAGPGQTMDVIACGPQQARKLAAALWMARYGEVTAVCVSKRLPLVEGHGPRLAPVNVVQRFEVQAVEDRSVVRLLPGRRGAAVSS
jgi:hypothetical protein